MTEIVTEWHSTPQLWIAYREGTCFCEDCRGKVPMGFGKTKEAAIDELSDLESELAS